MNEKLVGLLCATDDEAIAFCQMELAEMGYRVMSDDKHFVFGVPDTELVTPVLLLSHIDTVRKSDAVLPAEYFDTIFNGNSDECGALGADDRAGVYICLELASKMVNKPYVLFTTGEETGSIGMAAFLNAEHPELATHEDSFWCGKKLVDPYLPDIYAVLQYDREGYHSVVAYGASRLQENLINKALILGYKLEYGSTSDSRLFSEKTRVAHLNLSAGFLHQHTDQELLLVPALNFAIRNGVILMQMIDQPFRLPEVTTIPYTYTGYSYPNNTPTKPKKYTPVCDVCDKRRPVTYLPELRANLCKKCLRRVYEKYGFTYADVGVNVFRADLLTERRASRLNNLGYIPICPVGSDHTSIMPLNNGVFFCDDCGTYFHYTHNGVYWWDDNVGRTAYFRFRDNDVTVFTVETKDTQCPLDNCMICGKLMPDTHLSYYDNKETNEYELIVCDDCNLIDPVSRRGK